MERWQKLREEIAIGLRCCRSLRRPKQAFIKPVPLIDADGVFRAPLSEEMRPLPMSDPAVFRQCHPASHFAPVELVSSAATRYMEKLRRALDAIGRRREKRHENRIQPVRGEIAHVLPAN